MKHILNIGVIVISLSLLSGCNLYQSGSLSEKQIQIHEKQVMRDVSISYVDNDFMSDLAKNYSKYGDGILTLTVTYDPNNIQGAMNATDNLLKIINSLKQYGITKIESEIRPVIKQGVNDRLLISYTSYTAHAPIGCGVMFGIDTNLNNRNDEGYELGCSIETMVSRQVARPKDLLGRSAKGENTDGRSATNIIDAHRTGAQKTALSGESASGD